jgi:hypothetical protein
MKSFIRSFRLCESTLYENTRDVYGQQLPVGNWKYTLTHDSQEDMQLEIKALDNSYSKWSRLRVKPRDDTGIIGDSNSDGAGTSPANAVEGRFSTNSECEVKFIFSTNSSEQEIHYRCDVSPA